MKTRILILALVFGFSFLGFSQTRSQAQASIDSLLPSNMSIRMSAIRQAYYKTLDYAENTLNSKVNKVTGKQLSTVDFRVADSLKLAGLSETTGLVAGLGSKLDTALTKPLYRRSTSNATSSLLSAKDSTNTTIFDITLSPYRAGAVNTVIGVNAGKLINPYQFTSGVYGVIPSSDKNTIYGYEAARSLVTGSENTAIGTRALYSLNSSGADPLIYAATNTGVGTGAGGNTTSGSGNVFIGQKAGITNTTGSANVAIGKSAAGPSSASNSVWIGAGSAEFATTTGLSNIAIGRSSMQYIAGSGAENIAIGAYALSGNTTTGSYNVAIGGGALSSPLSGGQNISLGHQSLRLLSAGAGNVAIGYQSGFSNTLGGNNVYIGQQAGYFHTGARCIFLGNSAGNTVPITAQNVFVAGSDAEGGSSRIDDVFFGKGYVSTSPTNYTINGTGGSGTNINGGSITISAGKGTGNAASGRIIFSTSTTTSSGTTLQSLSERATIDAVGSMGIGTSTPNAASILDITSTTKGVLFPRMTTVQRNAILSPATGLELYNTTTNTKDVYNGSSWRSLADLSTTDTRYGQLVAANAWTATNTFSGNINTGNYSEFLQGDAARSIYGGAIVLTRNLNNTGSNPHGFDENSTLNATGNVAMNAFGVHTTIKGTNNYDHFNGFQCYPTISNIGTLNNLTDFAGAPTVSATQVNNRTGLSIAAANITNGGTILNQYGVRVDGMANATNNWAFFSNSPTKNFFGGPTQINYSSPQTTSYSLDVFGPLKASGFSNSTGVSIGGGFGTGYGGLALIGGTPYSEIQSIQEGVGYTEVVMQRRGGNVIIGGTTNVSNALLNIQSTTKGVLLPRMTTAQRDAITPLVEGLEIYNLDTHTKEFYNGTVWKSITTN